MRQPRALGLGEDQLIASLQVASISVTRSRPSTMILPGLIIMPAGILMVETHVSWVAWKPPDNTRRTFGQIAGLRLGGGPPYSIVSDNRMAARIILTAV
ncbi:MAG: hypothetical protein QOH35_5973 [Acidobacteriaceae bacterium]|jgi:hypothetical protein|nr:hypothetical protein [Acidobacteriaceae bacterium]